MWNEIGGNKLAAKKNVSVNVTGNLELKKEQKKVLA
jgi:hypothetical protein